MNIPDDLGYSETSNDEAAFIVKFFVLAFMTSIVALAVGFLLGKLFDPGYERLTGILIVGAWVLSFKLAQPKTH